VSDQPALSYLQAAAQGASPIGQVILLYDTILRDFARARGALEAGDIAGRVNQLNHALTVIGHLESVLDYQRGGEAARAFERFYSVTRALIVEANGKATRESLEQLARLYGQVRQAWYQADQRLQVREIETTLSNSEGDADGPRSNGHAKLENETPPHYWKT